MPIGFPLIRIYWAVIYPVDGAMKRFNITEAKKFKCDHVRKQMQCQKALSTA